MTNLKKAKQNLDNYCCIDNMQAYIKALEYEVERQKIVIGELLYEKVSGKNNIRNNENID